ncbi:MAG TPA: hypothetical protein VFT84_09485 [Gemmatimonadales bacterium]|nr:hypothetical protein [Gemmatimonadales bacterium]
MGDVLTEPDGISRDARGDEALISDGPSVSIEGLAACRPLFGLEPAA